MNRIFTKYIIALIAAFFGAGLLTATAAPASGVPVVEIAPDGTEVMVVAVGDENSRHFETLFGEVVEWLPRVEQHLQVRPLNLRLIEQRMIPERRNVPAEKYLTSTPNLAGGRSDATQGDAGQGDAGHGDASQGAGARSDADTAAPFLVVLVDFPDRSFTTAEAHEVFNRMMNAEDYFESGACGSVREYFIENSAGRFAPDFQVVGPVTMSHQASYYASVGIDDSPTGKLVIEACQLLDGEMDFSQFDLDGDGVCDNVYFWYAGKGQADGGGSTTIWPHSASLTLWGKSLTLDGVAIDNYACSPELNGRGKLTGIGTFCHEFCHVLGLPDMYTSSGIHPGSYSLMASGNYNNGGYTPPALSSYERYYLGWLEPEMILETGSVTLPELMESNSAYIIPTEREQEYFLLENRQQRSWDEYLVGHGMMVWHIDFDQQAWDDNNPNGLRNHPRIDLVEANGATTGSPSAGWLFPGSASVSSFDASTRPALKSWAGLPTDLALSEIAEPGDGTVTFHAVNRTSSAKSIREDMIAEAAPVVGVYSINGQYIAGSIEEASRRGYTGIAILRYADGTAGKQILR